MREAKLINNGISFNFFHVPDCHLTPVIARSAVPDSQNILTIEMKLRIIFLLHNTEFPLYRKVEEILEKTLMF